MKSKLMSLKQKRVAQIKNNKSKSISPQKSLYNNKYISTKIIKQQQQHLSPPKKKPIIIKKEKEEESEEDYEDDFEVLIIFIFVFFLNFDKIF